MTADIHPQTLRAEAACYALLRRLAPAMRHHLVVNLQPIGMIYEVLERRLQSATPDLGQVRESAAKINGFTRAAVRSCLDVITWLAPEENATSTVAEAVEECLGLLNGNLNFRGFSINNECAGVLASVSRPAVRCLLTSAMLACTDALDSPADLTLSAEATDGQARITLTLADAPGRKGFSNDGSYRALRWDEVEAIASSASAQLAHGPGRVVLTMPQITPAVPLTTD